MCTKIDTIGRTRRSIPEVLTPERIRELLDYDPETGVFRWRIKAQGIRAGHQTGYVDQTNGYVTIRIDGKKRYAHRLAWAYVTGQWPKTGIDHLDRDRTNNRFANLRQANRSENACNRPKQRNSSTGVKGVYLHRQSGRFNARISKNGVEHSLGMYATVDEAAEARRIAEPIYHGEFSPMSNPPAF